MKNRLLYALVGSSAPLSFGPRHSRWGTRGKLFSFTFPLSLLALKIAGGKLNLGMFFLYSPPFPKPKYQGPVGIPKLCFWTMRGGGDSPTFKNSIGSAPYQRARYICLFILSPTCFQHVLPLPLLCKLLFG